MDELSKWYADHFDKPYISYADNQHKIDLSMLSDDDVVLFIQDLQKHLSKKTYKDRTSEQIRNDPKIVHSYYFNTLTVDNKEILKSLKNVIGETK